MASLTVKVRDMNSMFLDAASFNRPLGKWKTGNVEDMCHMFRGAASFNHDISSWNVRSLAHGKNMFSNSEESAS